MVPAETPATPPQPAEGEIVIPADVPAPKADKPVVDDGPLFIPEERPKTNAPVVSDDVIEIPSEQQKTVTPARPATPVRPAAPATKKPAPQPTPKATPPTVPAKKQEAKPAQPTAKPTQPVKKQPERKVEDTGIDFSDGFGNQNKTPQKQSTKKKPVIDLEDEYYDLEGF